MLINIKAISDINESEIFFIVEVSFNAVLNRKIFNGNKNYLQCFFRKIRNITNSFSINGIKYLSILHKKTF